MNVIIPLGGLGKRFAEEGYRHPKPLIRVLGRPMIYWVIESLKLAQDDTLYIIYTDVLKSFNFEDMVRNKFRKLNLKFVELNFQTRGAAETLLCGLSNIDHDNLQKPFLIVDGDTFYNEDIVNIYKARGGNAIFYFNDYGDKPIFSYIRTDDAGVVCEIKEKERISDKANTGAYAFANGESLRRYCEIILSTGDRLRDEFYVSDIYRRMLKDGARVEAINVKDFFCVGTPLQLKIFCSTHAEKAKPLRLCFDLDNTLVSYPATEADYSTVRPIEQNIAFVRFLKRLGHTIIIYTARRMKTHHGNVGAVVNDIGQVTIETIRKFNIPCDELYFGKPYADFYIDDLCIDPYTNTDKDLGFYDLEVKPRSFNHIAYHDDVVVKRSDKPLDGEIYWYRSIPSSVADLFPMLVNIGNDNITISRVQGITFSHLYTNGSLTVGNLDGMFEALDRIHGCRPDDVTINIYGNYAAKLTDRYRRYNYSQYPGTEWLFNKLIDGLNHYEAAKHGRLAVIHGDPVFSNILLQPNNGLKFIDMRGKIDGVLSISGDLFYDFAKVYQSLIGYDHILLGRSFNHDYMDRIRKYFEERFTATYGGESFGELRWLTASLLFSLVPLHHNEKCASYLELADRLVKSGI